MEQQRVAASLRKWHLQDLRSDNHSTVTSPRPAFGDSAAGKQCDGGANRGPPWPIYVGVSIIQFFLPGILVSHGVYLSHLLHQEHFPRPFVVVWPPTAFVAVWCATRPIFRYLGFRNQGADCRVLAACGSLILAIGLATSSLTHSTIDRSITFGLIGGLGCSLAMSQCEAQLFFHFRPSIGLCMKGVVQSLGHFASPLILMALVSNYGTVGAPLVQAAIALHGLIGALLFRKKSPSFKIKPTSPATVENEEEDEIIYMSVSTESDGGNQRSEARSWKNPASDAVDGLEPRNSLFDDDDEEDNSRPRNHMGVEIMPQIVEEDEDEIVVVDVAQKRISRIRIERDSWSPAAPLNIYSSDQQDSTVGGSSPMPLLTPLSLDGRTRNVFTFNTPNCCSCWANIRINRVSNLWSKITDFAKKVCHKSMIPSVMLNVSQTLTQLGTAAIVPILGNEVVTFRRHEGAFSLAVMGFGWLCTSICAPCFLLPVTKRQKGLIASVLFFISSIGFSLLSNPGSHDRLTLGCIVVGMSHGAIINITPAIHNSLWGSASIKAPIQNCIDVITSIVIICCVSLTFHCVETEAEFSNVFLCLSFLQIAMGIAALAWTIFRRIFRKYEVWVLERRINLAA